MHYLINGGTLAFNILRKDTEALKILKDDMGSCKLWKTNLVNRLCESTGRWSELPRRIQECDAPLTKEYLQAIHAGFGENAWSIVRTSRASR